MVETTHLFKRRQNRIIGEKQRKKEQTHLKVNPPPRTNEKNGPLSEIEKNKKKNKFFS